MKTDFLRGNEYFIDEKVNMFKFGNVYNIFDGTGENIGAAKQRMTSGQKVRHILLGKLRALSPFKIEIVNNEEEVFATITRGWTFFKSIVMISDTNDSIIAIVKTKYKFRKPTFVIEDGEGIQIAEITGDWKAWNFTIDDLDENNVGTITKKWNGALKEIFTTADKYVVTIDSKFAQHKTTVLSAAIAMDMLLKNHK